MDWCRENGSSLLVYFIKPIQVLRIWADMWTIAHSMKLFQRPTVLTDHGNKQLLLHHLGVGFWSTKYIFLITLLFSTLVCTLRHWIIKVKWRMVYGYILYFFLSYSLFFFLILEYNYFAMLFFALQHCESAICIRIPPTS